MCEHHFFWQWVFAYSDQRCVMLVWVLRCPLVAVRKSLDVFVIAASWYVALFSLKDYKKTKCW